MFIQSFCLSLEGFSITPLSLVAHVHGHSVGIIDGYGLIATYTVAQESVCMLRKSAENRTFPKAENRMS